MRSAGCAVNDVWDARFDAQVKRTRDRPVATGEVSRREALLLAALPGAHRLRAGAPLQRLHHRAFVRRARARGDLSAHQALLPAAAGLSRHRVRVRHPDGVRGAGRTSCRRPPGRCSRPTSSGRSPTIPSTRWSTATTTSRSASGRRRSLFGRYDVAAAMACYGGDARDSRLGRGVRAARPGLTMPGSRSPPCSWATTTRSSAAARARAASRPSSTTTGSGAAIFAGIVAAYALGGAWPRWESHGAVN